MVQLLNRWTSEASNSERNRWTLPPPIVSTQAMPLPRTRPWRRIGPPANPKAEASALSAAVDQTLQARCRCGDVSQRADAALAAVHRVQEEVEKGEVLDASDSARGDEDNKDVAMWMSVERFLGDTDGRCHTIL